MVVEHGHVMDLHLACIQSIINDAYVDNNMVCAAGMQNNVTKSSHSFTIVYWRQEPPEWRPNSCHRCCRSELFSSRVGQEMPRHSNNFRPEVRSHGNSMSVTLIKAFRGDQGGGDTYHAAIVDIGDNMRLL